jgi:hypothetical protein
MRARGTAHVLTAFDLGYEIDLARAAERLGIGRSLDAFRHKRGSTEEQAEARKPLRFSRAIGALELGEFACAREIEVAVYPYGAVNFTYTLPLDLPLERLVDLSTLLYDHAGLRTAARAEAAAVLEALGDAVREPFLAQAVEDYVIYSLEPAAAPVGELETSQRQLVARILRAEQGPLSLHEVENALDGRIAYGPDELVLVDWFGALLVGADMEDERRVLELTTVELVELRFLDGRLEQRLEEAYGLLTRSQRALFSLSPRTHDIERLARFQADSAILHENFDNALKLLGDDYLARLYELCSERFHFAAWDTAIERKLATLENIYSKISDRAAHRRAELLEWIIILLFVADILLYFLSARAD